MGGPLKFLVIRRDNIGDLVCVTPLLRALRRHYPDALICALVNSYNRAVLEHNPDVDQVFAYTKAKHREPGQSVLRVYWDRLCLMGRLRSIGFDYVFLAAPGVQASALRLARWVRPKKIVAIAGPEQRKQVDIAIPLSPGTSLHEAEDVFRLLAPLGITGAVPEAAVYADAARAEEVERRLGGVPGKLTIGIHISARKPSQRWPAERFVELVRGLSESRDSRFLLLWAPGSDANPHHPGDDAKAGEILKALSGAPILGYPTTHLGQLVAALSLCDVLICSDGGAMHLAAGLGKPILCFFGQSDATRWHPWGVPYAMLQPDSREVKDIGVTEARHGFGQLLQKVKGNGSS